MMQFTFFLDILQTLPHRLTGCSTPPQATGRPLSHRAGAAQSRPACRQPLSSPGFSRDEALKGRLLLPGRTGSYRPPHGLFGPPLRGVRADRHRGCHRENGNNNSDSSSGTVRFSPVSAASARSRGRRAGSSPPTPGAEAAGGREGARAARRLGARRLPRVGGHSTRSHPPSAGVGAGDPAGRVPLGAPAAPPIPLHFPMTSTARNRPRNSLFVPPASRRVPQTAESGSLWIRVPETSGVENREASARRGAGRRTTGGPHATCTCTCREPGVGGGDHFQQL